MDIVLIILVAALTFGVCYLFDKGFRKIFRSKVQHATGLSVRLNKKYATFGIVLSALGVAAILAGIQGELVLGIGGGLVTVVGIGLIVYYMTFGVFYNEDSFVLTTFGKRSVTYQYNQIVGQQLYMSYGSVLIELHMKDGRSVGLQAGMEGVYPFLDKAFENWCRQTGRNPEECEFHDPDNSLWFPSMEDK